MHQIIEKMLNDGGNWEDANKIFIDWLEEKAKEIADSPAGEFFYDNMMKILGLSDSSSPEKVTNGDCPNYMHSLEKCGTVPKPSETKKEWCNHQIFHDGAWWHFDIANNTEEITPDQWDICPVKGCHTPRPKELSLEEKLEHFLATENYGSAIYKCKEMAEIAKKHFQEIQKEK